MKTKKETNIWFGLILIGIAIIVICESLKFPLFILAGKKLPGPNFFPVLLSIILLICGGNEILFALINKPIKKTQKSFILFINNWGNQNILIIVSGLIIYVFILQWLGFVVATFLLSSIFMIRLKTGWLRGILFSMILVIIITLLFGSIFRVQLPVGFFNISF